MTALIKTRVVSAIRSGTVIDHITPGYALTIVKLLKLAQHNKQVALGLNLPSNRMGYKDIIKVEERFLTPEETSQVSILAPDATISIIENYEVSSKYSVQLPAKIEGIIPCPNPRCVTNSESKKTILHVLQRRKGGIRLECRYCRKVFSQPEL